METVGGRIADVRPGTILVEVPYTNWQRFALRQYDEVVVGFKDARTITPEQRRKAYALLGEIVEWSGDDLESVKDFTKRKYLKTQADALTSEYFSLSDCDITTAREYIDCLVKFIIKNDVPCKHPLYELMEDVKAYVYQNLKHRKCAVCGKKADLHHAEDRVGMGRNREEIIHEGMRVMPLCRTHHMECHTMSQQAFNAKYHLESLEATKEICKWYGLKTNE